MKVEEIVQAPSMPLEGNLATIGRKVAMTDFGRIRFSGRLAWLLWGGAHVLFLIVATASPCCSTGPM